MAATKRKIDLRNVKESGNFRPRRVEEGEYLAKITAADDHTSNKGGEGWVFTVMLQGDQRSTYPVYVGSDEKSAWKVRKLMIAAGLQAPKSLIMFDPNKLVNKAIGVFMEDDEYEGREKSTVADYIPVADLQGQADDPEEAIDEDEIEDEEPEEEAPQVGKRVVKKAPPVEDEEEEEVDDEPEPTPPPRRKRRPAPAPVVEDDEEEEEEEETPAPPPRRKRPVRKAAPPVVEDDEEDDLDLDDLG